MAEEHHLEQFHGSDDTMAMRAVLLSVKGSSPISLAPVLAVATDGPAQSEQFEFES